MEAGDMVLDKTGRVGIVERVDEDYYGARQAFKRYRMIERGKAIRGNMVDGFGPTKDGISHRVLVIWSDGYATYEKSNTLQVYST